MHMRLAAEDGVLLPRVTTNYDEASVGALSQEVSADCRPTRLLSCVIAPV